MKTFRKSLFVFLCTLLLTLAVSPVFGQSQLTVALHRDFGLGNGSQIRGTFTASVTSPSALKSVTYLLDGKVMQEVTAAPFKFQFHTDTYGYGWHELSAQAVTTDGTTLTSSPLRYQFVSPEEEKGVMTKIFIPIGIVLGAIIVISIGSDLLIARKTQRLLVPLGAHRSYGLAGGSICPRCNRPTPLHWYALNIGFGTKFDRCENCGHWGTFSRRSPEALARAEAEEVKAAQPEQPIPEASPEQQLKEQIDQSKYMEE